MSPLISQVRQARLRLQELAPFRIADLRLQILDCSLEAIYNLKSTICNPVGGCRASSGQSLRPS
jgi:hypothetical protein